MNDSDQFLVYVCIYFNTSALHSSASGFSRKKMNKRYSGDAALFFSSFLFDGVGHVLRLYHQDSILTWLFTRLKNNGLVFSFFSFNFHY